MKFVKGMLILFICVALLICAGCVQKGNNDIGKSAVANQTTKINETAAKNDETTAKSNETTVKTNETIAKVNETTFKANGRSAVKESAPVESAHLMAPGSAEEKAEAMPSNVAEASAKSSLFVATINTPRPGDILTGNNDVNFSASVTGGRAPYNNTWTSNINGVLSHNETFSLKPSDLQQGQHTIVLLVMDASGQTAQASVIVSDIGS